MGKEVEYTATFDKFCDFGINACLENIRHNGKRYTDHVWIAKTDKMAKYKHGDKIRFIAVAHTYTDKKGERKNGIGRCHHFMLVNNSYDESMNDYNERNKRISR